jgi:hypothetical protein
MYYENSDVRIAGMEDLQAFGVENDDLGITCSIKLRQNIDALGALDVGLEIQRSTNLKNFYIMP